MKFDRKLMMAFFVTAGVITFSLNGSVYAADESETIGRLNEQEGFISGTITEDEVFEEDLGETSLYEETVEETPLYEESQSGWVYRKPYWYYYDQLGRKLYGGWIHTGGHWYYLSSSGAMQTGWIRTGGYWYYLSPSGAMQTGWIRTGGYWYYLSSGGAMQTGWIYTGGQWYYLSSSGAMQTGWIYTGGQWYYLSSGGAMYRNCWIGDYYLKDSGAMAVSEWVGGKYYVDENGRWVPDKSQGNAGGVAGKLLALKSTYPEGMSWGNDRVAVWVTQPWLGYTYTFQGEGCYAFVMEFTDDAFGGPPSQVPPRKYDFDNIKVGDILRIDGDSHSVVVLEIRGDSFVIVEGNYNRSVHWGRVIKKSSVNYYQTRY